MPKVVRPVKFIVQPVFVIDDGEHLEELPVEPIAVSARDWPAWAGGGWRQALEALQDKLSATEVPS